ncbi:hypothetical protein BDV93DRAFT_584021 [Ceratobasidium sp. AG-I]|nr:hypothetical protein BDV93DRAFT_584021 [Ceratobasidium sp. AG-I]
MRDAQRTHLLIEIIQVTAVVLQYNSGTTHEVLQGKVSSLRVQSTPDTSSNISATDLEAPSVPPESPISSYIKAAYEFVVENYVVGDHVVLFDMLYGTQIETDKLFQKNQYLAMARLATALALQLNTAQDKGSLQKKSGSSSVGGKILINRLMQTLWTSRLLMSFFNKAREDSLLQWSGFDKLSFKFPSTVENFLCFERRADACGAYVIQRGSQGQIKRKEVWYYGHNNFRISGWLMLQTRHFIDYDPSDLKDGFQLEELLGTVSHSNCTKRRGRLPCRDGIPMGGQLIRTTRVSGDGFHMPDEVYLIWSSQNYAEGEYGDVFNMPPFGPDYL